MCACPQTIYADNNKGNNGTEVIVTYDKRLHITITEVRNNGKIESIVVRDANRTIIYPSVSR